MDATYPGHGGIIKKIWKLFKASVNEDPVNNWECDRLENGSIRGNANPIVKILCVEDGLWQQMSLSSREL